MKMKNTYVALMGDVAYLESRSKSRLYYTVGYSVFRPLPELLFSSALLLVLVRSSHRWNVMEALFSVTSLGLGVCRSSLYNYMHGV